MAAAEEFFLMSTFSHTHQPLQYTITLLFSVLHTTVMDYAKNSHEYFQVNYFFYSRNGTYNDKKHHIVPSLMKLKPSIGLGMATYCRCSRRRYLQINLIFFLDRIFLNCNIMTL
jgi:hypothetical protein